MKIKCIVCSSLNTKNYLKAFSSHGQRVYKKTKQFNYYQCSDCEALFLTGIKINKKFYKTFYPNEYRETAFSPSTLSQVLTKYSNSIKKKTIEKFTTKKKVRLLDIGSGDGSFLIDLDKTKYISSGLEVDNKYFKIYRENKISLVVGDFLTKKFKDKFDVITAWHVVEHISSPNKVFKKVNQLLPRNGIFVFSIPNYESIGFSKGKEDWFHLDAPRHLVFFTNKTVHYLASKYKFEVLETKNNYFDFPTDLFWSLRNSNYKWRYYLLYPIYKFVDRETMTYIFRKND